MHSVFQSKRTQILSDGSNYAGFAKMARMTKVSVKQDVLSRIPVRIL